MPLPIPTIVTTGFADTVGSTYRLGHDRLIWWASTLGLLAAALTACTGGGGPAPSSVFTDDNVYGPTAPAGATQLTPDEFEAKVKDGTLTLDTAKDHAALQAKQDAREAQDRALLAGLPDKSPSLTSMLGPKTGLKSAPGGEYLVDVPLR